MLVNLKQGNSIEPQIILNKEFRVVGIKGTVKPGEKLIGNLWDDFNKRISEICNTASLNHLLGLCEYMPDITDESEFNYIACIEVNEFCNTPEGMTTKVIPPSKYAVFTHMGPMNELKATYSSIYGAWLPSSGYELAELDTIELYYQGENNLDNRFDIYIPIK